MAIRHKHKIVLLLFLFFIASLAKAQERNFRVRDEQNCSELSGNFDSLEQALEILRRTRFTQSHNFKINRKKGLKSGEYLSCDGTTGYLILLIDENYTIFYNVSKSHWEGLTTTNDPDYYIRQEISKKYVRLE